MKFKLNDYTPSELKNDKIKTFLDPLPEDVIDEYASFLTDQPKLNDALTAYFDAPNNYPNIVPIVIYNELTKEVATLMANKNDAPEEPGEEGSILALFDQMDTKTHSCVLIAMVNYHAQAVPLKY